MYSRHFPPRNTSGIRTGGVDHPGEKSSRVDLPPAWWPWSASRPAGAGAWPPTRRRRSTRRAAPSLGASGRPTRPGPAWRLSEVDVVLSSSFCILCWFWFSPFCLDVFYSLFGVVFFFALLHVFWLLFLSVLFSCVSPLFSGCLRGPGMVDIKFRGCMSTNLLLRRLGRWRVVAAKRVRKSKPVRTVLHNKNMDNSKAA